MTRAEYEKELTRLFQVVGVLSRKEGKTVLHLRHRKLGREMVFRSYPGAVAAYEYLKNYRVAGFPEVYDVIRCDDGTVVLEQWIEASPLSEHLSGGCFTYRGARSVLRDLAGALAVLHKAGYVHRDIKPDNILLTEKGRAVLLDLETGRAVTQEPDTTRLGTTGYAAPEQYVGRSDAESDVYALGVLLNVMLTGRHPSDALPKQRKARRIVKEATAVNPGDRFPDAEAFAKAL